MKLEIKDLKIYRSFSKMSKPIADSTHEISEISFYIVEVVTKNGVRGQGYLLSFHYSPKAILGALEDVKRFILNKGYSVHETVRFKQEYEVESEYFGDVGLQRWAQATINVAMWDAWCKSLGQPVWRVLGGSMKTIPVYGSGGWLSYSDEELLNEVLEYKRRGFKAVKIKVGSKLGIEHDLSRLRKCRQSLGNEIRIMMDANQGMRVSDAIKLAEDAKVIGIQWFEEPIIHTDIAGYELIRNKCGTALAMGEREYDLQALKELISRNAIDLWQPDIIRIGGVEAWKDSASLATAYNIPVLPHYYKDYDVPLLATISNGFGSESFDWIDSIIDNPMKVENGYAYPRNESGWGFSFKEEYLYEVKL